MNQSFQYHRLVLGYHGCDQSVADRVLAGEDMLKKSEKHYDWLGSGIYFWEHGPERAMDCSMINWLCDVMQEDQSNPFDSVRGMFQEADASFPGSSIRLKSHIQLAIRNPTCVLGCFRPSFGYEISVGTKYY